MRKICTPLRPQCQKLQESEASPSKTLQIFSRRESPFDSKNRSFFRQKIADPDEVNPKVGWPQQEKRFFGKRGIFRRRDFFRDDYLGGLLTKGDEELGNKKGNYPKKNEFFEGENFWISRHKLNSLLKC